MGTLEKIESRLIDRLTDFAGHLLQTGLHAFKDYKKRHIGISAASVSFYAIFSVFPLLAFLAFLVGKMIGTEASTHSAPIVLKILRDYVPAMQGWIEKGLFEVIKGTAVTNGINAVLLGWSSLGLFSALEAAISHLPEEHGHGHRAQVTMIGLAATTLALFAGLLLTMTFCELAGRSSQIPFWLQGLPFEVQDSVYIAARSGLLLGVVSIFTVAAVFKLLLPVKLRVRSALVGAGLFTGLLLLSRGAYWIYLHYNKGAIQTSYGIFSTLILIMLWVHFIVSCLVYSCLFALKLDHKPGAAHGHGDAHGSGHGDAHGHAQEHKHAA